MPLFVLHYMQSEMVAEAAMAKVKTEIQSLQDLKFAGLTREVEGLKTDLDKVKNEIRYEVDKVTAGQRDKEVSLPQSKVRGKRKRVLTFPQLLSSPHPSPSENPPPAPALPDFRWCPNFETPSNLENYKLDSSLRAWLPIQIL
ncbi:unnamed protein product [Closterium sp. Naga37s-1]|nr:unnamed protein product [Closterium sp. Naga37s-1]